MNTYRDIYIYMGQWTYEHHVKVADTDPPSQAASLWIPSRWAAVSRWGQGEGGVWLTGGGTEQREWNENGPVWTARRLNVSRSSIAQRGSEQEMLSRPSLLLPLEVFIPHQSQRRSQRRGWGWGSCRAGVFQLCDLSFASAFGKTMADGNAVDISGEDLCVFGHVAQKFSGVVLALWLCCCL